MMEKEILNELREIKRLIAYQLLAAGITPKGLSKIIGVSEKRVRNQFPMKEITRG